MNLYTHRDRNVFKTWVFMTSFFLLILLVGYAAAEYYGNSAIIAVFFAIAILMNFFSYWFSDKLVLRLHKAKPATREAYFDLWNVTENLSITAGLPMPKLYVIEDAVPNAFATGRNAEHAVVAVTTGLLQILDRSELEGVIAHELSHIGNKDMLLSTVVVMMAGFIALISDMFLRSGHLGNRDRNSGGAPIVIIGIVLAILGPIAASLIQLAVSRKREFLADATGALLTRYPEGLASALRKIESHSHAPMRTANNATAHLFISNPFGPQKRTALHKLFLTHPPVEERIKALTGRN